MNASNVKISDEVMESSKLTLKRKQALRREVIFKYIDSKPVGTPIKLEEFRNVANFKTVANCHAFINGLINKKLIMRHDGDKPRSYSYTVTHATTVTKAPKPKGMSVDDLETKARQWAWDNNSDSLRGFITSLKG